MYILPIEALYMQECKSAKRMQEMLAQNGMHKGKVIDISASLSVCLSIHNNIIYLFAQNNTWPQV